MSLTWVLKQASENPRIKLVVKAISLLGSIYPMSLVSPRVAFIGKLMNMRAYVMRLRIKPRMTTGCLPHLMVKCARNPKMSPPATSPVATMMALRDARDFLSSPNLK